MRVDIEELFHLSQRGMDGWMAGGREDEREGGKEETLRRSLISPSARLSCSLRCLARASSCGGEGQRVRGGAGGREGTGGMRRLKPDS